MKLETNRLIICKFKLDMAEDVHLNSLDEDNRKFVPDEVFETIDDAKDTLEYLISCYESNDSPLVYPILLKDNSNIGYVQAILLDDGTYEVGYHIAKKYTCNGYASEALKAFLPFIMEKLNINEIYGVCLKENVASIKVLEKVGFNKVFDGISSYQGEDKEVVKYKYSK
jgi:RimJ/RimL family protein N-acetyltransferase